MAGYSKRSGEIANAFHKYVDTGDRGPIDTFELEELELAAHQFSADRGSGFHNAMVARVDELKERRRRAEEEDRLAAQAARTRKEKWKDRAATFILGIISGIVLMLPA